MREISEEVDRDQEDHLDHQDHEHEGYFFLFRNLNDLNIISYGRT